MKVALGACSARIRLQRLTAECRAREGHMPLTQATRVQTTRMRGRQPLRVGTGRRDVGTHRLSHRPSPSRDSFGTRSALKDTQATTVGTEARPSQIVTIAPR